jgi:HPt (histidine-containing phosphotransfer) domain-containing protein
MKSEKYILKEGNVEVDLRMIFDLCGEEDERFHKMLSLFIDAIPETQEKLGEYFRKKDWDSLFKTAHKAKSTLSIIKVSPLYQWILTVEASARTKNQPESLGPIIEDIIKAYTVAENLVNANFKVG